MRNPDTELTSTHRGRWLRLVVVLALGLAIAPFLFAIAWFTFAGGRLGWVLTMLAFGAFGFACGWLAVSKQWPVVRRNLAVGLAIALGLAGIVTAHLAPPTAARLRDAINDVAQPRWKLVKDSESGNAACFDYCTSVTREYTVDGDLASVSSQVETAVESLDCPPPDLGLRVRWDCRHGDDIKVTVELTEGPSVATVYVTATSG